MPGPLDRILAGADGAVGAHIAELVRTTLMAPDDVAVTGQQLTCRCRAPTS
ncbi:MAG TPA: hypothetical protein VE400_06045 [Mycobacterium sp.]|nr:hypothetical protein [Mycobacterium sp.]